VLRSVGPKMLKALTVTHPDLITKIMDDRVLLKHAPKQSRIVCGQL